MAEYSYWTGKCPICKKPHEHEFVFYFPVDGEVECTGIECECGCIFEISCEAEVDVNLYNSEPVIIHYPENAEEYYETKDPNQLSLDLN
jgi:hypothetical protein